MSILDNPDIQRYMIENAVSVIILGMGVVVTLGILVLQYLERKELL